MGTIKCPQCKLVNNDDTRNCRRCGTPLFDKKGANNASAPILSRPSGRLIILIIVAVAALGLYSYFSRSKNLSSSQTEIAGKDKALTKSLPSNSELESVKALHRDFIARLDQNAIDPNKSNGLKKDQTLALDTMMSLKDKKVKITDPAADKFLDEFSRRVEKYYNQLVQFNSDTAHIEEVSQGIASQIRHVREDASLSPEVKAAKHADLVTQLPNESKERSISARQIEETVKSLRNLSVSEDAR
jgi:hypothetical protein